ncbi:MAG: immunoglobulin domain-containing protein [Sedimentisphaerales bacterium]|nr:immunoglobulin domain-containing protein [Sedimentisphaerales bacterium]
MLKRKRLFLLSALSLALLTSGQALADTVIGLNISGAWATPHLAGETADGFSNWTDSQPIDSPNGNNGSNIILNGSNNFVAVSYSSDNLWWAGPEDTSEEQLYRIYLDDGGNGPEINITGLNSWLASEGLGSYQITVYQNTDNGTIFTPIDIKEGSTIIDTFQGTDLDTTGSLHGKANSMYLTADSITIKPQPRNLSAGVRASISGIKITGISKYIAIKPSPAINSQTTIDQEISWELAPAAVGEGITYNVYFGNANTEFSTDPNAEPNTPNPGYYVINLVKTTSSDPADFFYAPPALENSTRYYWRVDALVPGNPVAFAGPEWTFVTAPPSALIVNDPKGKTVAAGTEQVQFTVGAINASTYQWYKDGIVLDDDSTDTLYSGETSATLTIYDVQLNDEGFYYCMADNELLQPAQTKEAQLLTKRLIGWWKFDNSLDDSVNEEVAAAPGHNGTAIEAAYSTSGIDGSAYSFDGTLNKLVAIPNSEKYFNCYTQGYTISTWVKMSDKTAWGAFVSKQSQDKLTGFTVAHREGGQAAHTIRELFNDILVNNTIDNEQWHQVVATYDANSKTGSLFVDGILITTATDPKTGLGNNAMMIFGAETPEADVPYIGLLDDVRMWSYALDKTEIALLYSDFNPGVELCIEPITYDISGPAGTRDCKVDLYDLAAIASQWLDCNIVPTCIHR